jgi:CHASE2 domain
VNVGNVRAEFLKGTADFIRRLTDWRQMLRLLREEFWTVLIFSVLTLILNCFGVFDGLENPIFDTAVRLHPLSPENGICRVVRIDDPSYKELFESKSPLKACKLTELLNKISTANTALIVVDIDTSDPSFAPLQAEKFHDRRIIWSEGAQSVEEAEPNRNYEFHREPPKWIASGVLGGDSTPGRLHAIAAMEPDRDCIIRGYFLTMNVLTTNPSDPAHPKIEACTTLPRRIIQEYKGLADTRENGKVLFDLSDPSRYKGLSASDVWHMTPDSHGKPDKSVTGETWNRMADGKIILLGGTFSAARDKYPTPVGYVDGVKLIGMAVDSALSGPEINSPSKLFLFGLDFLFGLAFVLVAYLVSPRRLVVLAVIGPVIGVALSLIFFRNCSMFLSFVPVNFGIYLHLVHRYMDEHRRLMKEVSQLRAGQGPQTPNQESELRVEKVPPKAETNDVT